MKESPTIVCNTESSKKMLLHERESRVKLLDSIRKDHPYMAPEVFLIESSEFRICHYMIALIDALLEKETVETWDVSRTMEQKDGCFYPKEFGIVCYLVEHWINGGEQGRMKYSLDC